ncbi:hypothetical protein ACA910_020404 [Epithemia clementina (nom. ined.)]
MCFNSAGIDACALNNMAVAMMTSGDYRGAVGALKSSLTILKTALGDPSKQNAEDLRSFARLRQEKLDAASMRLSHRRGDGRMTSSVFSPSSMAVVPHLKTIENNDVASLIVQATTLASTHAHDSSATITVILIREAFPNDNDGGEVESGTILYNYGVACSLLLASSSLNIRKKSCPASSSCATRLTGECGETIGAEEHESNSMLHSMAQNALLLAHAAFSRKRSQFGEDPSKDLEVTLFSILTLSVAKNFLLSRTGPSLTTQELEQAVHFMLFEVEDARMFFSRESHEKLLGASAA